jgi:hypothetical protein
MSEPINFQPDPSRHFAQVAKPETFVHDSFRQEDVQQGVTKVIGTLQEDGKEAVYGFHFDSEKFTLGEVQTWTGRRGYTVLNVNPAEQSKYPYCTSSLALNAPMVITATGTKTPRCSIMAYGGDVMNVSGFGRVVIDLKGLEIPKSFPLLGNHENTLDSVVGQGQGEVRNGQLLVDGPLVTTGTAAAQIMELNKSGVSLSASVGVEPTQQRRIMPGETIHVNGKTITADDQGFILVQKGRLREVSILPIGADCSTTVSIAAKFQTGVPYTMSTDLQTADQIRAAAALETSRVNLITAAAAKARQAWGQHMPADMHSRLGSIEAAAIRDNWSADQAELEILRAARPQQVISNPWPGGSAGGQGGQKFIEAAWLIHTGHENIAVKEYGEQVAQQARDAGFRHCLDIVRASLRMGGMDDAPSGPHEMLRAASEPNMIRATGFSTLQLPATLSNIAQKTLINSYQQFPSVAKLITRVLPAKDFKASAGMRITGAVKLEKIGPQGEIPHGFLDESIFSYKLETYAKTFGISRQDLINDDLTAFADTPMLIGRGAAVTFEETFWKLLLSNPTTVFEHDSNAFFSAGHNNYLSGAGTTLGAETLATAVSTAMKMVDRHGYPISAIPKYLVVPPELKVMADGLCHSMKLIPGEGLAASVAPSENVFYGRYEPVASPYLSNASYTNYSAVAWYLFCDPGDVPLAGIAYLNGQQTPTIESGQQGPDLLGIYFRAFFDFAVALIDPRGGVMVKGAA